MIMPNGEWSAYTPREGERIRFYNGTQDGHGGRAAEHRAEMKAIAEAVGDRKIKETVPKMVKEIDSDSLESAIRGIKYDIETIVNIAFDDGRDIFNSSKARKMVSDAIYNEIIRGLDNLKITL